MGRLCSIDGCGRPHQARGWCLPHYKRWKLHGDPLAGAIYGNDDARFWSHVRRTATCWLWEGSRTWGYGKLKIAGRSVRAHVWAWEREHGSVPEGHELHHRCGTRACVRPSHLVAVTRAEHRRLESVGAGR